MPDERELLNAALQLAGEAGRSLLSTFGGVQQASKKGDPSQVVTEADLRSERLILEGIRRRFPGHSIVAEETGYDRRGEDYTWVVDPLDGTSNYAAGIPWFGVLICVLRVGRPVVGVLHTPVTGEVYSATAGGGAHRNGQRISVAHGRKLEDVLWAYGMDGGAGAEATARHLALLQKLVHRVRNLRATNSLIDAAYTADGRLGGMVNQGSRLWDIAAPALVIEEAGGLFTTLTGEPLELDLSPGAAEREYAVLGGAPDLHREVAALARETLADRSAA